MFSLILAQLVLVFILAIKKVRSIPSLLPCWMTLWARQCMAADRSCIHVPAYIWQARCQIAVSSCKCLQRNVALSYGWGISCVKSYHGRRSSGHASSSVQSGQHGTAFWSVFKSPLIMAAGHLGAHHHGHHHPAVAGNALPDRQALQPAAADAVVPRRHGRRQQRPGALSALIVDRAWQEHYVIRGCPLLLRTGHRTKTLLCKAECCAMAPAETQRTAALVCCVQCMHVDPVTGCCCPPFTLLAPGK